MTTRSDLASAAPWVELSVDESDWDAVAPDLLLTMLAQTQWIRVFEEQVLQLAADGLVHGPAHPSIGQEGGAVGSIVPLRSDDFVNGSHRGRHQFLAKAFGHVMAPAGGELPALDAEVRTVLRRSP